MEMLSAGPRRVAIGLGLLALGWTTPALGQEPSAQAPPPFVKVGETVWAKTADGREVKGKVTGLSTATLDLRVHGSPTSLPLSDLIRVETRDSLKNGATYGAIPSAAFFGFIFGAAATFSNCPILSSQPCHANAGGWVALGALFGAGVGALAGAGIDRAIPGRRVLFQSAPARRVRVEPLVQMSRVGVRVGW